LGKVIAKNIFNRLIISALRLFHSLGGVSQVAVTDGAGGNYGQVVLCLNDIPGQQLDADQIKELAGKEKRWGKAMLH
jgi:hypothetical protein